ncbi:MAG: hypothetical protein LBU94_00615 [Clostridiales bacterium]|nr:hypothetical protein [Clostridiales bacterium]
MEVKSVYKIVGTTFTTPLAKSKKGPTSFVYDLEKMCKDMGIETGIDFEELKKLQATLEGIRESNNKAAEELKKQVVDMKRKIAENMVKIVRMLNGQSYTKDSWKASMDFVSKAAKILKNKEATSGELNECLKLLRSAMSKLQPARKEDERGEEHQRNKALKDYEESIDGQVNPENYSNTNVSGEGLSIDISIDASADVSASVVVSVSETV